MRFLANENFPLPSSEIIEKKGYEILLISKEYPGISDLQVMEMAKKFDAIILTFDKDYGEIIFKLQVVDPPSVIFFREKGNSPLFAGSILIELLAREDLVFEGRYTVVEKNGVRQREIS